MTIIKKKDTIHVFAGNELDLQILCKYLKLDRRKLLFGVLTLIVKSDK